MQDAGLVLTLNADSEVVRYTHDRMRDIVHAEEVLDKVILPQYKSYGVGRWAVYLKSSSEFTGWCGLKYIAERNEYDLGYRYLSAYWGKGYATEAAMACLQFGFEIRKLERIVGRAMPENVASLRVLEKCGMHYIGTETVDGHLANTYEKWNPGLQK